MSRPHLAYRNIHKGAVKAADKLFSSKPWRGTEEEQYRKFEKFLKRASRAYDIPPPALEYRERELREGQLSNVKYSPRSQTIVLERMSVLNLFIGFRFHLQAMGAVDGASAFDPDQEEAFKWGCSLFYTSRPKLFRKAVRKGRVQHVRPEDLLASDSTYEPSVREAAQDAAESRLEAVIEGRSAHRQAEQIMAASQAEPEVVEEDLTPSEAVRNEPHTPEVLLDQYQMEMDGAPATVAKHERIARSFVEWVQETNRDLDAADDGTVEAWLGFAHGDKTASTQQTYRGSAKRFLKFLANHSESMASSS